MSEWFHVGQKVVCVNADPYAFGHTGGGWFPGEAPIEGRHYTVTGIHRENGYVKLTLAEISRHRATGFTGYRADRFRPLRKRSTDISIFKEMLVSPPKEVVDA